MPQHPTWFVPKKVYEKIGTFDESFKIGADYEFACRAVKAKVPFTRIEKVITHFQIGGITSKHLKISRQESRKVKIKYGYLQEPNKKDMRYENIRKKCFYWFEKVVLYPVKKVIYR
jgi:hypothetical protein